MSNVYTTVQGFVGTDVDYRDGNGAPARATFRLASTPRYFDASQGTWRDQETLWFTVKAWRALASNVSSSVRKGEPVVVHGRMKSHTWRDDRDEERSRLEIEAISVGHDLSRGTSAFLRKQPPGSADHVQRPDQTQNRDQPRHETAASPGGAPRKEVPGWPPLVAAGERPGASREAVTT